MKKLLVLPALLVLASCISLPSLTEENKALVRDLSMYICAADKAGALKDGAELTPEQLHALIAQFQNTGGPKPTLSPEQLQARMETIGEDPVQLALFVQALATEQMQCASGNTNA